MRTTQVKHRMLAFAIGVLWGTLGMHQFYLNRNANGFAYIGFGLGSWLFMLAGILGASPGLLAIGSLVMLGLCLLLLIDLFRLLWMSDEEFDHHYNF